MLRLIDCFFKINDKFHNYNTKKIMNTIYDTSGNIDFISTSIFYLLLTVMFYLSANSFVGGFIGIIYPIYILNKYPIDPMTIKYFYIYGHLEFIYHLAAILSLPLIRYIRLILTLMMIYHTNNKSEIINNIYHKLIIIDQSVCRKIMFNYYKLINYDQKKIE